MRRSSLDVSTTKGTLLARIVPSFGMLSCQTLRSSNNVASNAWSTLSSSSIRKTQGLSYRRARNKGPAVKNCCPYNSVCRDSQSTLLDFDFNSTHNLCNGSSKFPL